MDVKMRKRGGNRGANLGRCRQREGECRLFVNTCFCVIPNRIL